MMRLFVAVIVVFGIAGIIASGPKATNPRAILDVSWPNCDQKIFAQQQEGIIGINGGLDFRPNPCLARQTGWFKHFSVYVNSGYPGIKYGRRYQDTPNLCAHNDNKCLAYNYGYNAARYDIKYASLHFVVAQRWWIDVETENSWTGDPYVNRSALQGMADALGQYAGKSNVGYYSYPGQWNLLTKSWKNGLSAWAATGSSKEQAAHKACKLDGFTGGKVLLAQYVQKYDTNLICHLN